MKLETKIRLDSEIYQKLGKIENHMNSIIAPSRVNFRLFEYTFDVAEIPGMTFDYEWIITVDPDIGYWFASQIVRPNGLFHDAAEKAGFFS